MKNYKLTYDDIKLNAEVKLPNGYQHLGNGILVGIENFASLSGINEPIFTVKHLDVYWHFGLKYIRKNYIKPII